MQHIMTVIELINTAAEHFREKGFENARLEVERMLGNILGLSRINLYLAFDRPVTEKERNTFRAYCRRRLQHEPLQHIIGTQEFGDLTVKTDRRALIPRPETEQLACEAVAWLRERNAPKVIDIGTGTGIIALSIAQEITGAEITAVDISRDALDLARENAAMLGLENRVTFFHGSLLDDIPETAEYDAVVSNPPYVARGDIQHLEPEVRDYDPQLALDGGEDGLESIRKIVDAAHRVLAPGGMLMFECGDGQGGTIKDIIDSTLYYTPAEILKDIAGRTRIVKTFRRETEE